MYSLGIRCAEARDGRRLEKLAETVVMIAHLGGSSQSCCDESQTCSEKDGGEDVGVHRDRFVTRYPYLQEVPDVHDSKMNWRATYLAYITPIDRRPRGRCQRS